MAPGKGCTKLYPRAGVRVRLHRDPQPSVAIVDSHSLKRTTAVVGGEQRGYDGAKKVKGSKHHLLVDTEGDSCSQSQGTNKAPR